MQAHKMLTPIHSNTHTEVCGNTQIHPPRVSSSENGHCQGCTQLHVRHVRDYKQQYTPSTMAAGTAIWMASRRGTVQNTGTTSKDKPCSGNARKLNSMSTNLQIRDVQGRGKHVCVCACLCVCLCVCMCRLCMGA